jgi:hypothetical protein
LDIRFVAPEWASLDRLRSEAVCTPFFEEERPLEGALGLFDWRMSGAVSALIANGTIRGSRGEKALLPARPKLPFDKLFLFGLGSRADFSETAAREATRLVFETLAAARVRASTCVLPGRTLPLIGAARSMEILLEVLAEHPEQDEVTIIEHTEAQKTMAPVLERQKLRARVGG